jgi:hypothetical protein
MTGAGPLRRWPGASATGMRLPGTGMVLAATGMMLANCLQVVLSGTPSCAKMRISV